MASSSPLILISLDWGESLGRETGPSTVGRQRSGLQSSDLPAADVSEAEGPVSLMK